MKLTGIGTCEKSNNCVGEANFTQDILNELSGDDRGGSILIELSQLMDAKGSKGFPMATDWHVLEVRSPNHNELKQDDELEAVIILTNACGNVGILKLTIGYHKGDLWLRLQHTERRRGERRRHE